MDRNLRTAWRFELLGLASAVAVVGVAAMYDLATGQRRYQDTLALVAIFGPPEGITFMGVLIARLGGARPGYWVFRVGLWCETAVTIVFSIFLVLGVVPFAVSAMLKWRAARSLRARLGPAGVATKPL